jgi:rhodanese-related sulfurtransferase
MPEPVRIQPGDAKALVDAGEAIVLDVVSPHDRAQIDQVVQGSIRIPPNEIARRWRELPSERAIIAYCT